MKVFTYAAALGFSPRKVGLIHLLSRFRPERALAKGQQIGPV